MTKTGDQMLVHGRILHTDETRRLLEVVFRKERKQCYLQRAQFNRLQDFLHPGNFVVLAIKRIDKKRGVRRHVVETVKRIVRPSPRRSLVLYSETDIRTETVRFLNGLGKKLFLDLEMSMHPYHKDKDFKQEIIQAGYVLVNAEGETLETFRGFIRPTRHKKLTKRTKKFLGVTQEEVEAGLPYEDFHEHLQKLLQKHRPAVIVWGKNDILALKESFAINRLPPIRPRIRFVNLLELYKTYYGLKDDVGLLTAFNNHGEEREGQRHDAYDDALMTKAVFERFLAEVNALHPRVPNRS